MVRCALVGNYGAGNLGDELLRESIVSLFPEIEWTVVSARPGAEGLPRLPGGLRSLWAPWHRTLRAFSTMDAVVFGGGTLFTDIESLRACMLWWEHASAVRVPLLFAYQGVGPFRTGAGERLARSAFRRAAFISVRDRVSAERMQSWSLNTEVIQTFDPVFSYLQKKNVKSRSKNVFVIIPRPNASDEFWRTLAKQGSAFPGAARILLMQPDHPGERAAAARARRLLPHADIAEARSLQTLSAFLGDAACVLTQRYHGAIAALSAGVPTVRIVPQRPGDKLAELRTLAERGPEALVALARRGDDALRAALRSL